MDTLQITQRNKAHNNVANNNTWLSGNCKQQVRKNRGGANAAVHVCSDLGVFINRNFRHRLKRVREREADMDGLAERVYERKRK